MAERSASVVAKSAAPHAAGLQLQRKCACGVHAFGGECPECARKKQIGLQRKELAVGSIDDPLEAEADRVATQVTAAPDSASTRIPVRIQRAAGGMGNGIEEAPASVERALADAGSSLDPAVRGDMEQRFGHDFSRVRVHADVTAAVSARELGALAYTVGNHIVLGAGQLAPNTGSGRRLLAHELTHVVQQSGGTSAPMTAPAAMVRRSCGEKQIGETEVDDKGVRQELGDPGVKGILIRFKVGCDDFLTSDDEVALRTLAQTLPWRTRIVIHGFASEEGPVTFNKMLSLARAVKARDILSAARPTSWIEGVVWHGSVPGKRADRRAVVIETLGAAPALSRSLTIVSWINGKDLPAFSRLGLAIAPGDAVEDLGACMAIGCTANTPPPDRLPPTDLPAFLATKQYRAVQSYAVSYAPAAGSQGEVRTRQIIGYTAPSSCGPIPPKSFRQGEVSPLNSVSSELNEAGATIDALMKLRVSSVEESEAIDAATSFPASLLVSRCAIKHVPWVWSKTHLALDAHTGRIKWNIRGSAFPTNTVYLDGARVAQIDQGPCRVLLESRFRSACQPRQTMGEEAKQENIPINKQEETVEEGMSASGSG